MKLIYLSTDELNQALVRNWAGLLGIEVDCPDFAQRAMTGPHDAILLDTDHLPSEWLAGWITRLGVTDGARSAAGHGYGTAGDDLRGRGVTVHTRLRRGVLQDLILAAMSSDTAPVEDTSDALTWVNLV